MVAKKFGVKLSLVQVGKVAKKPHPPFGSRPRGPRGRDVDLGSFVAYLIAKSPVKSESECETPEEQKGVEQRKADLDQEKRQKQNTAREKEQHSWFERP